tara:strand:- start:555 stop:686 length:132 start_codon:yes stop_codon:yes gene_type:complete
MSKTKRQSIVKMRKEKRKAFNAEVMPELLKLIEEAKEKENGKS